DGHRSGGSRRRTRVGRPCRFGPARWRLRQSDTARMLLPRARRGGHAAAGPHHPHLPTAGGTTYDELGGYPHPDHIKNHAVTMAAVAAAADGTAHPELGEPWQVQKVYYNQDLSAKKWITIHEKMTEAGLESPFAEHLEDFKKRDSKRNNWLSTRIPCAEFFPARDRALLSHATQIDPEGGFFSASRKAARTYWPTEEFELA